MKNKLSMAKRAVRLFKNDIAPVSTYRHNARQWVRAVEFLGDKWILANPITRSAA